MFESEYKYYLLDHKDKIDDSGIMEHWLYGFRTRRRRYIVRVERYDLNIYIIKFHADCHSASKEKYHLLFNDEQPSPIIMTCIRIMLDFFHRDPIASFGFIGSNSCNKRRRGHVIVEGKENTQRFRIYQTVMFYFFGEQTFEHSRNITHSAYLLINKKNADTGDFRKRAEKMFRELYTTLE